MGMNVRKMSRENGVETLDRWEGGERVEVRMTLCVVSAVINESKALLTSARMNHLRLQRLSLFAI